MHCKKCGHAIGTDRGICPFCGAMLTPGQYKEFEQLQKDNLAKVNLLTEKYGEQKVLYEKRKETNKGIYIGIIFIILLLLIIGILLFILIK